MSEKFTPDFGGPTLKQTIVFELISWYGRYFRKNRSNINKIRKNTILIDLGFGSNYTDGWIHIDFFSMPKIKFWKKNKLNHKPDIETDLRYPLKCKDNSVDGVYCGHTIEHLWPNEAYRLLREIYRVLKPGSWLRINFPDLKLYIDFYNKIKVSHEFNVFKSGAEAISNVTQNYGHHSVWDEELIIKALSNIGFVNSKKVEFGKEGTDKRLIKEEQARKWETLVIEAQKPLNLI
ncbi:MAG TPA: methyltransferase domain-containing protein [Ignavibacteriales bacterium]|nr:methyltransferase domain-containing protein [Ignavibacteriales bacterium]